jgi:hypothetical protein
MQLKLASFTTSKLAKEAGFNLETIDYWVKEQSNSRPYLTTGVDYDSDQKIKWDWNFGGSSGILAPYPNKKYEIQYSAPTLALLQKWLEGKGMFIRKYFSGFIGNRSGLDGILYGYEYNFDFCANEEWAEEERNFDTWDEALEQGIKDMLKLIIIRNEIKKQ